MSRDLSIEIATSGASFVDVLRVLLGAGWEVRDVMGTSYLPASATDGSDWKMFSSDSPSLVLEECGRRESAGLAPALVLLRQGEDRGGQFVWLDGRTLVVSMNVNLADDWDFGRLASEVGRPLEESGIPIERVRVERC
jgi:hypothetical protein